HVSEPARAPLRAGVRARPGEVFVNVTAPHRIGAVSALDGPAICAAVDHEAVGLGVADQILDVAEAARARRRAGVGSGHGEGVGDVVAGQVLGPGSFADRTAQLAAVDHHAV